MLPDYQDRPSNYKLFIIILCANYIILKHRMWLQNYGPQVLTASVHNLDCERFPIRSRWFLTNVCKMNVASAVVGWPQSTVVAHQPFHWYKPNLAVTVVVISTSFFSALTWREDCNTLCTTPNLGYLCALHTIGHEHS